MYSKAYRKRLHEYEDKLTKRLQEDSSLVTDFELIYKGKIGI